MTRKTNLNNLGYINNQGEHALLILTRNIGGIIMINDDIEIHYLDINRGRTQIRLGIKAPDHVIIHRKEIYDQIMVERGRK